jgi:hypothetical protein
MVTSTLPGLPVSPGKGIPWSLFMSNVMEIADPIDVEAGLVFGARDLGLS